MQFTPSLEVREVAGRVRLLLGQLTHGEGATLQEAADDLVARVLVLAMAVRSRGIGPVSSEGPGLDLAALEFLYEVGELASGGDDIRERLFGWTRPLLSFGTTLAGPTRAVVAVRVSVRSAGTFGSLPALRPGARLGSWRKRISRART